MILGARLAVLGLAAVSFFTISGAEAAPKAAGQSGAASWYGPGFHGRSQATAVSLPGGSGAWIESWRCSRDEERNLGA